MLLVLGSHLSSFFLQSSHSLLSPPSSLHLSFPPPLPLPYVPLLSFSPLPLPYFPPSFPPPLPLPSFPPPCPPPSSPPCRLLQPFWRPLSPSLPPPSWPWPLCSSSFF